MLPVFCYPGKPIVNGFFIITEFSLFTKEIQFTVSCNVTRSVSKMTEIERRGGKRWDKPKKAGKSRDCRGGKF